MTDEQATPVVYNETPLGDTQAGLPVTDDRQTASHIADAGKMVPQAPFPSGGMIERIARVICTAHDDDPNSLDGDGMECWRYFDTEAVAAIQAVRAYDGDEITRLRAAYKAAAEHGNNCYADTLRLPHCDVGFCQCGKAPK